MDEKMQTVSACYARLHRRWSGRRAGCSPHLMRCVKVPATAPLDVPTYAVPYANPDWKLASGKRSSPRWLIPDAAPTGVQHILNA